MTFSTPEREALRLCAMVEPDWSALTQIARTALDYGRLRRLALLHQLDGVVAWRLLDDKLDGVVPNIVREDCQRYLDHLNGYGVAWRADWELLRSALEAAGIEYVQWGGIIPYAEYPLPSWPRMISDIDLAAPGDKLAAVREVFGSFGLEKRVAYDGDTDAEVILPGGTPANCRCAPNNSEWACRNAAWVFDGAQDLVYLGAQIRTPSAAALLLQQALDTWSSVHNDAGPLPLHALAYIANLAARLTTTDMALIERAAKAEGERISKQAPLIGDDDAIWRAFDVGAVGRAAWVINRASEAYELPEVLLEAVGRHKPQEEPAFPVWDSRTFAAYTWHRWADWPGAESFMFDHRGTCDPTFYVNQGLWQRVPGFERAVERRATVGKERDA